MATRKKEPAEEFILDNAETEPETEDQSSKIAEQQAQIRRLEELLKKAQGGGRQNDAEVVRLAAEKAAAEGVSGWDVEVSIRVPRRPPNEEQWYWISVNGRSAQIPANDKYQTLKLPWAETLINMLEAERRAEDFADSIVAYDPITNPKQ